MRFQNDVRFPWIVLIPALPGLTELQDLSSQDYRALMDEVLLAGAAVRAIGEAAGRPVQKLNVGALGNVVAQLHVHVVGRRADDPAWPGPVWGFGEATVYEDAALSAAVAAARAVFGAGLRS